VQQAFTALAAATTVDEVKRVRDQWAGLTAYARAAKDKQLEADAAEIRMRAERRLGEMMKAGQKDRAPVGRPTKNGFLARVRVFRRRFMMHRHGWTGPP
jgi:hypothetical protein